MKKLLVCMLSAVLAAVGLLTFGCADGEKDILVVSREASSGTREAFEKYAGLEDVEIVDTAEEYKSTGEVRTKVAGVETAIGYISLASVDSSVKALKVEGVAATAENVKSGSYKIQRPFLLLTNPEVELTAAAQDFFNFCMSKTAIETIEAEGGIMPTEQSERPAYTAPAEAVSGAVTLRGSTSMEKMLLALEKKYKEVGGEKVSGVTFTNNYTGSSDGRTAVKNDTTGAVIGAASSSSPSEDYEETRLCLDAVAIIVNKNNDAIDDINAEQLKKIYTGEIKKFSELAA